MKLRLRENSIRLRLLQNEVKTLEETGNVSETITFSPAQKLVYRLKVLNGSNKLFAEFTDGEMIVSIPSQKAREWFETDLVGLENEQEIESGKFLKILIEKDFVCLERPFDKDNADAFPHPKMNC